MFHLRKPRILLAVYLLPPDEMQGTVDGITHKPLPFC